MVSPTINHVNDKFSNKSSNDNSNNVHYSTTSLEKGGSRSEILINTFSLYNIDNIHSVN